MTVSDSPAATVREPPRQRHDMLYAARTGRAAGPALALVLAVALGVRLWGAAWQLPWQFHPDEGHYTWKAMELISSGSLDPKYFRNPTLFTYVLYAQYRLLGFQDPKADEATAAGEGLLRPPSGVAFVGRLNSVLMGWATVAAIAWTGWRLLGPWTGVLAGAFLGLAFIHVRDSHYATNDVPATFLLVLSVAASLELLRRPTARIYLLAGLLGGLATSTKYSAGFFFVPLVLAHFLAGPRPGAGARPILLVAALGAAALGYLIGTPYTLLNWAKFSADFRTQMRLGGEEWEGQAASPSLVLYSEALGQGIGWVMLAFAAVGLVLLARRRPRAAAVIAAFPVAYLLFMLRTELFFARFVLPAVPFVCLLAACGVVLVVEWARQAVLPRGRGVESALGIALALAALVQPTLAVLRHDALVLREDTRVLAAQWALANIPADAKVGLEEYTIRDRRPRAYGGPSWQLNTDAFDVNGVPAADPTAPLRGGYRYLIVSSFEYERFRGAGAKQAAFYDALEREGRLLAGFGPGPGGAPLPFDLEDLYTPFWGLERYERPGPTIRIYAVDPP